MGKELKVYTSKQCKYCTKLKNGLDDIGLKYIDIDVDNPENDNEVKKIYSLANEAVIPIITVQPNVLVPNRSFNTIDEALDLIKFLTK